jgi:hypothetical protein
VKIVGKARKQKEKLPVKIQMILHQLAKDIEDGGPVRGDWPNYSKLSDSEHHCHLKRETRLMSQYGGKAKTKSDSLR